MNWLTVSEINSNIISILRRVLSWAGSRLPLPGVAGAIRGGREPASANTRITITPIAVRRVAVVAASAVPVNCAASMAVLELFVGD